MVIYGAQNSKNYLKELFDIEHDCSALLSLRIAPNGISVRKWMINRKDEE
jgi:hypothetical protein